LNYLPLDKHRRNVYMIIVTKGEFKKLRESIEYSQARLSTEMDVTIRSLTRWETGEVAIPKIAELALRYIADRTKKKRRR